MSFAIDSRSWAPSGSRDHEVEGIVAALLGLPWRGELPPDGDFGRAAELVIPLFERAAARWFGVLRITERFSNFVREPHARPLLLPALKWLADAAGAFMGDAWEASPTLDEALVQYLRKLWSLERAAVTGDDRYNPYFEKLLAILAARGSHAAQALRDELVGEA